MSSSQVIGTPTLTDALIVVISCNSISILRRFSYN